MIARKYFRLFFTLSLLTGCVQQTVEPPSVFHVRSTQSPSVHQNWIMEGRLGVKTRDESFSANIIWKHHLQNNAIELSGPLGQGTVRLDVNDERTVVDDGEHVRIYQGSADRLLEKYLGTVIPVQELSYWVLGQADPEVALREMENGFEQREWKITYREMQVVNGVHLPRKMILHKDSNQVKLVVDRWEIK